MSEPYTKTGSGERRSVAPQPATNDDIDQKQQEDREDMGRTENTTATATSTERFAFFDVDNTLIRTKTMFEFQEYYYGNCAPGSKAENLLRHEQFVEEIEGYANQGESRSFINQKYYESFSGRDPDHVRCCASEYFSDLKQRMPNLYIPPVLEALEHHASENVEPVLVSGSSVEMLAPLAEDLGVRHILATRLEIQDDAYTGRILPPQMIGEGKREAVKGFLKEHGGKAKRCFAYGDHPSDLPMLEAVGNPRIVAGDEELEKIAMGRSWRILPA